MTVEAQGIRSDGGSRASDWRARSVQEDGPGVHAQASSDQDRRGPTVRETPPTSDVARFLAEPSPAPAPERRTAMGSADAFMPDHATSRAPGPARALPDPVPDTTDRLGAAIDRLRAALAASRQAREQAAVSPGAATSVAGARSPVGTALSQVPGPNRIKDLSENPEKALVAATATAASKAAPGLSPAVQTIAKAVEKQVDRARDPSLDGPTR